ncbi:MAG: leishmanolysin-related zinc metalloendopeptidase [Gemmatimonadales bacterium]
MSMSSLRAPRVRGPLLVAALGAAALAACSNSDGGGSPVPASVQLSPGSRSFTAVGQTQQFMATVRDAQGNTIAGVGVTWSSTNDAIVSVDGNGLATAEALGGAQVRATAGSVMGSASVTVGTTGAYAVDVRFLTTMTPTQQQAFTNAAGRWQTLITGDVADLFVSAPAGTCGANSPVINETVDDIIIFATIEAIDGPGSVLAQAGPCYIRVPGSLPIVGRMRFDSDDVPGLELGGQLQDVILHEMGHVLGYGVNWASLGLLADTGTADPYFTGVQARQAFDSIGPSYAGGNEVPVEDQGGAGTRNAHWRELVFNRELMTGFLDAGVANPLSVVSVASMADLGYAVNRAASDPFSCPGFPCPLARAPGAPAGPVIELRDDVLTGPIRMIDARGRVTGIFWR